MDVPLKLRHWLDRLSGIRIATMVIVFTIMFQLIVFLEPVRAWPFLDYPMYARPHTKYFELFYRMENVEAEKELGFDKLYELHIAGFGGLGKRFIGPLYKDGDEKAARELAKVLELNDMGPVSEIGLRAYSIDIEGNTYSRAVEKVVRVDVSDS